MSSRPAHRPAGCPTSRALARSRPVVLNAGIDFEGLGFLILILLPLLGKILQGLVKFFGRLRGLKLQPMEEQPKEEQYANLTSQPTEASSVVSELEPGVLEANAEEAEAWRQLVTGAGAVQVEEEYGEPELPEADYEVPAAESPLQTYESLSDYKESTGPLRSPLPSAPRSVPEPSTAFVDAGIPSSSEPISSDVGNLAARLELKQRAEVPASRRRRSSTTPLKGRSTWQRAIVLTEFLGRPAAFRDPYV